MSRRIFSSCMITLQLSKLFLKQIYSKSLYPKTKIGLSIPTKRSEKSPKTFIFTKLFTKIIFSSTSYT